MTHLIVSREYPPCAYPLGGIGTYVAHIARLLAERGETVHVIGEQWRGAPLAVDVQMQGRLIIHRVSMKRPAAPSRAERASANVLEAMRDSPFPAQAFSWQAALLAESLVRDAGIDVIEGQDYEAPLFYFMLRRAVGLGPDREPPCFVHLHSPTQFICHHNGWPISAPRYLLMHRQESYVIDRADAWLCPSRYLSRQAETHYGLGSSAVVHIPLPRGDTPWIDRSDAIWDRGTICYVGRLEPRKGVFEWLSAAIQLGRERPGLQFELIGADLPLGGDWGVSVGAVLAQRIPEDLKTNITFVPPQPRKSLWERLSRARLAAVPSRWENFPNTCVEAMATGLPVVASPEGGMVEMIEDGRTGWISKSAQPEDLANVLRRALDTPPNVLAVMGRAAATSIERLCDNDAIVRAHLRFREEVLAGGAHRSLHAARGRVSLGLLDTVPTLGVSPATDSRFQAVQTRSDELDRGIAVVVVANMCVDVERCLSSIAKQTVPPTAIVIATDRQGHLPEWAERVCGRAGLATQKVCVTASRTSGSAGIETILAAGSVPLGLAIVDAGCQLDPRFLEGCETVLARNPEVGVISTMTAIGFSQNKVLLRPVPQRPYQWVQNDVSACAAFRTAAITAMPSLLRNNDLERSASELALAVLLQGWAGVTYPAILSTRIEHTNSAEETLRWGARSRLISALRACFPEAVAADGQDMLHLFRIGDHDGGHDPLSPSHLLRMSFADQVRLARRAVQHPRAAVGWIAEHGRRAASALHRRMRPAALPK